MKRSLISRRSFVAGAVVALSGCIGGTSDNSPRQTSTIPGETTTTDDESSPTTTVDATPTVAWDEVAEFRKWLTEYSTISGSNHRFDYQRGDSDIPVGGRFEVLDLSRDSIDGRLIQSGNVIHLGTFDVESLTDRIESSEEYERTDEYGGYAMAERMETGSKIAVGKDAILAGSEIRKWIDARLGRRDRLEEVTADFTRVFRRLPDRGLVTGQYGAPTGGEIDNDDILLWGHSMANLSAETGTWIYVFKDENALTANVLKNLENGLDPLTQEITSSERDGRFATITATPIEF